MVRSTKYFYFLNDSLTDLNDLLKLRKFLKSQTNQKGSHIAKDIYVCTYSNCKRSLIFDYELLNSYLFLSHIFKHRVTHKVPNFDSQSAQITLKWRNSHTYEPKFSIPKEICMSYKLNMQH